MNSYTRTHKTIHKRSYCLVGISRPDLVADRLGVALAPYAGNLYYWVSDEIPGVSFGSFVEAVLAEQKYAVRSMGAVA